MKKKIYNWEEVETVIDKYSQTLYKIAYSYTGNKEDSEDILQEVYIRYASQNIFSSEEHKKAWLIRVTINLGINLANSASRKRNISYDNMESIEGLHDAMVESDSEITTVVMELPVKYRAAIYLYYYEEYTVEEIAMVLKKRPASIYTLLNRGRKMLKDILKGGGENE